MSTKLTITGAKRVEYSKIKARLRIWYTHNVLKARLHMVAAELRDDDIYVTEIPEDGLLEVFGIEVYKTDPRVYVAYRVLPKWKARFWAWRGWYYMRKPFV